MDFESLKQSSGNFDKITKALEASSEPQQSKSTNKYQDDRLWKPELDKTGNGYAVLRFLPATSGEEMPWQRVWSHAFQDKGGWFIENSLTTLNQKDPVSEENSRLWNTGVDSDKEIARKRKRKLSYFANVLIVSDPKHLCTLRLSRSVCLCVFLCLVRVRTPPRAPFFSYITTSPPRRAAAAAQGGRGGRRARARGGPGPTGGPGVSFLVGQEARLGAREAA